MLSLRSLLIAASLLAAAPAAAEDCLSALEQREAIAANTAIPLARASDAARARHNGEVINARLCRNDGKLAYFLTMIDKQGKVVRAVVNAANGTVIQLR